MANERFWTRVDKAGPVPPGRPDLGPCWLWTGRVNEKGYGIVYVRERAGIPGGNRRAHRHAWTLTRGPIPDGLVLDHTCRVRRCVRIDHLEPVDPAVNTQRGMSPGVIARRTNRCGRGHDLSDAYVKRARNGDVRQQCRRCTLDGQREQRRAHVALAAALGGLTGEQLVELARSEPAVRAALDQLTAAVNQALTPTS